MASLMATKFDVIFSRNKTGGYLLKRFSAGYEPQDLTTVCTTNSVFLLDSRGREENKICVSVNMEDPDEKLAKKIATDLLYQYLYEFDGVVNKGTARMFTQIAGGMA